MPRTVFFDNLGKRVGLGAELGRGGEAVVYSVEGRPGLVAKIYHQPPCEEKAAKLSQMVSLQNERLLALTAWPLGTLFTVGSKTAAGFLMRNVARLKDIHLLYSPKSRTREFPPKANWRFLIHTASNVARAFAAVHDCGHVIGDVNQSNVRVSAETAIVSLVDCDSFQISADEKIYPCEVGVPLYTPPELQNKEFREIVRTPNHDNFGLAVLIFHLLFMGRHPFAGKFLGVGEMPIEKAISEQRFAFARDVHQTQMQPPPACITLDHLPQQIGDLFTSAFCSDPALGNRPDGRQWIAELDAPAGRLMVCTNNKAHLFFNGVSSCPWCSIESSGILLFVDYVIVDPNTTFSIELIWARILAVPSPGAGKTPSMLTYISGVEPSPQAKAAARRKRYWLAAGILGVLVVFGLVAASDNGFMYMYLLGFGIPWVRKILDDDPPPEFVEAARAAERRLRNLQFTWQTEASGEVFNAKLDELRTLTEHYRKLPELRKQKIRELERALHEIQLRRYLEQFDLASADIPLIKDGRKAMLSAYGIDDAADVTKPALESVPGFGEALIIELIAWRKTLERNFRFSPGRGIDPSDIQRVDREIAKRRAVIEGLLSKGPNQLSDLRRSILAARGRLQDQLEKATMDVAQAQADERASV